MTEGCFSCSGRCCYDIVVPVTPFDAWRIARDQLLAFEAFVEPCITPRSVEHGFRLSGQDRYSLVLRRHPIEAAACTFLAHVSEEFKRCGIYPVRPLVCRVYPFEIRGGSIDIRTDARCKPSDWDMAALDYARRGAEFARYAAEWEACRQIDAAWNAALNLAENGVDGVDHADAFRGYLAFIERVSEAFFAGAPSADRVAQWSARPALPEATAEYERWLESLQGAIGAASRA
ncbi:MAG: YkgJ family cysteine cluster protein [Candidatus Eremiobacteraeota bacterium]|nr:YkgJ family cysteine cluster protein [Candidatus Eremiobacteraeota bacterium]